MHRISEGLGWGEAAAGLGNGAMKQAPGAGHGQQGVNAKGSGRFPENRYLLGISAIVANVIAHPAQGLGLIKKAVVSRNPLGVRGGEGRMGQEPHDAQAIVQGYDHDPLPGEGGAIVSLGGTGPPGEATAVNPHHHRRLPLGLAVQTFR